MSSHLVNGRFQSDKYPTCPAGKVPLSTSDPTAQDLLWAYAQRRRAVDAEFSDDLERALLLDGFRPPEAFREDFDSMDDYQAETNRTEMAIPSRELMLKGALGLCGEAGEVSELIKKHVFHGKPLDPAKVEEELGDVFWYLSQLARACGTTLRRVATGNAKKLRKRYPDGYSHAASAARVDVERTAKPKTEIAGVFEPGKMDPQSYVHRETVPACEHGSPGCPGKGDKHACEDDPPKCGAV